MLSGKDRGKRGNVLRMIPKKGKVVIEGLNTVKKHVRPRKEGEKGQRIEVPAAVDVSNVMLVCKSCGKPARVGFQKEGDKKERVCKKCGKAA